MGGARGALRSSDRRRCPTTRGTRRRTARARTAGISPTSSTRATSAPASRERAHDRVCTPLASPVRSQRRRGSSTPVTDATRRRARSRARARPAARRRAPARSARCRAPARGRRGRASSSPPPARGRAPTATAPSRVRCRRAEVGMRRVRTASRRSSGSERMPVDRRRRRGTPVARARRRPLAERVRGVDRFDRRWCRRARRTAPRRARRCAGARRRGREVDVLGHRPRQPPAPPASASRAPGPASVKTER